MAWSGELGYGVRAPEQGQTRTGARGRGPAEDATTATTTTEGTTDGGAAVVFLVGAAPSCLGGAIGVVAQRNPVHAALSLVATLFGVAVLFVAQDAHFLAAVQVIVYAGAIVVLFLFVIMLLGVDQAEDLAIEPLGGQRPPRSSVGLGVLGAVAARPWSSPAARPPVPDRRPTAPAASTDGAADIDAAGESLFTDYVFAFEITVVLLMIAVVGRGGARRGKIERPPSTIDEPRRGDRADEAPA